MEFGYTALQWMEWRMHLEPELSIRQQFNRKEKRIGYRHLPIDGYDVASATVFQFHGCYWHRHDCERTCNMPQQLRNERRRRTDHNADYLRKFGYRVGSFVRATTQPLPGGRRPLTEATLNWSGTAP